MILEADNIELSFNNQKILYGIYVKAEQGKVTGILGRNGCGKTSFLRILFGDLKPKYKNIRFDGIYQKRKLFLQNNTAYLPQHQLLPKNIKLKSVFYLFDLEPHDFINMFESFKRHQNSKIYELSFGELKVLETYLILMLNKKIILLDEPFSFIAPLYIEKIKALIHLKKEESIILITDHFYKDIMDVSDTVYLFKNGRSKEIRSKKDLEREGYLPFNPQQK
ncbi:ATP-binding cassette domain-containing protein [Maribacter sp. 2304DJ31-5]|uniref:ATP-binding cassette domain-containing protein n=1 Tax=Maribacter sp. 2304DJ31-5 TaxID=3386273 RepID=UPI0039BC7F20